MKSRRLAMADSSNDPFLNDRGFNSFVAGNSGSLSSRSPYSGVGLGANNSSPSDSNDYLDGFDARFISSMAVLVVVITVLFCEGFCIDHEERVRNSRRRPRGSGNAEGSRGLDRAAIESFPVFSYDLVKELKAQTKETLECAVCLGEFEDDEQLRLLPQCSHVFHPDCIDTWLFSHTTCPVCRTTLVSTDNGNPTGTGYGIIEPPEITPPDEVAVVVVGTRHSRSDREGN